METLLTKVVNLGYSGWTELRELRLKVYVCITLVLTSASEGAVRPAFVPKLRCVRLAGFLEKRCQVRQPGGYKSEKEHEGRTNLIATWEELRRFVPMKRGWRSIASSCAPETRYLGI